MKRIAAMCAAAFVVAVAGTACAKTFVYVSNADDGNIDGFEMNSSGALTPLGKTVAGKLVMPMAVSPVQKHLYAVVRTIPFKVVTFRVDGANGALKEEANWAVFVNTP